MLYEIIKDCRINNKDYKVGDIVDPKNIGGIYTSVMKATDKKETVEEETEKKSNKKSNKKK